MEKQNYLEVIGSKETKLHEQDSLNLLSLLMSEVFNYKYLICGDFIFYKNEIQQICLIII